MGWGRVVPVQAHLILGAIWRAMPIWLPLLAVLAMAKLCFTLWFVGMEKDVWGRVRTMCSHLEGKAKGCYCQCKFSSRPYQRLGVLLGMEIFVFHNMPVFFVPYHCPSLFFLQQRLNELFSIGMGSTVTQTGRGLVHYVGAAAERQVR